jgi:hypothetical protein
MAVAFAQIEGATKSATGQVGQQKYKYSDLTSVIEAIKPALVANGLFFTQHPEPHDRGVQIETILHHAGGESVSLGKLFVPANKADAQGFGSALTYARRYALVTAFGVPVEDDDGNAAAKSQAKPASIPDGERLTDEQWAKIVGLCQATNIRGDAVKQHVRAQNLKILTAEQYASAVDYLETKLAELTKAATAKEAANV